MLPREYPARFGHRLVDVYQKANPEENRRDLRRHYAVDFEGSDKEVFQAYPTGDTWGDAKLVEVVLYIWNYKGLSVPDSWATTMEDFISEIKPRAF